MTGYDADASSALTTLAGVFQLLIESHIVWLHTTGNTDKTDLAPSTIMLHSRISLSKLGACTPARDRFELKYTSIDRQIRRAAKVQQKNCS